MTASDNDPGDGPGSGAWRDKERGEFVMTFYSFRFDPTKGAVGTTKVRVARKVAPQGASWSGRFHLDFYDNDGNLGFAIEGTMAARRLIAERP
jgi:hypothetical protein